MSNLPDRVAIVYDWVTKWGGAEQILLALHNLFPQAPLYTAVYNPRANWARVFPQVIPTFLNRFPFASTYHEIYPLLTPLAFESLDFSKYDLLISVTSADAKGIITPPQTLHICYCLTPTRYLWSHQSDYAKKLPSLVAPLFKYLKFWDHIAANRPDTYLAISKTVQSRIKTYYHRDSQLVYPPVNLIGPKTSKSAAPIVDIHDYYLWVGRFVPYKKPLKIISEFNKLNLPLVMVGSGSEFMKAKKLSGPNIRLMGQINNSELNNIYQNAKALVVFHEEDFGLVSIEAQSAGVPVIALNSGGVTETVIDGETGIIDSNLSAAITRFQCTKFDQKKMLAQAQKFSAKRFSSKFVKLVTTLWTRYQNTPMF